MDPALTGGTAAALYASAFGWQLACALRRQSPPRPPILVLGCLAALLHLTALWPLLLPAGGVDLGLFTVFGLVSLMMVLVTLVVAASQPVLNLLLLLYPLAGVAVVLLVTRDTAVVPRPLSPGLTSHVLLSLVAYATLSLAAAQALLVAAQEQLLRHRANLQLLALLPPLTAMETMLFRLLQVGFVLLTLALASGAFYITDLFDQRVVHHTVLSISAWLVYGVLLWGHHALGWRGRSAVHWTLGGFVLLALAYFGSKVVMELILAAAAHPAAATVAAHG